MIPQVIFICIVWFLLRLITFQGFIYFFNLRIACSCFAYFLLVYMVDWLMALKTYAHVLTPGSYECELPWRKGCCVGPSLLMALLLAVSAWGSHSGMITSSKPLTFPQRGPSCGPCDSSRGHRIHFSKKLSVNFEEQDLLFTSPEVMGHEDAGGGEGRDSDWTSEIEDPSLSLDYGPKVGCLGIHEITHYWLIWSLRTGMVAAGSPKLSFISVALGLLKGELHGWLSSLTSCFTSRCAVQLAICFFKMNVFWNGCLGNRKLIMSGTYPTRVFAAIIKELKMRPSWVIWVGPQPIARCPYKRCKSIWHREEGHLGVFQVQTKGLWSHQKVERKGKMLP